jgi:hypothetical protein
MAQPIILPTDADPLMLPPSAQFRRLGEALARRVAAPAALPVDDILFFDPMTGEPDALPHGPGDWLMVDHLQARPN